LRYEEREEILAYMGTDVLLADEMNVFRAAGIREVEEKAPVVNRKATILNSEIFSDNFSDKTGFFSDNYPLESR